MLKNMKNRFVYAIAGMVKFVNGNDLYQLQNGGYLLGIMAGGCCGMSGAAEIQGCH